MPFWHLLPILYFKAFGKPFLQSNITPLLRNVLLVIKFFFFAFLTPQPLYYNHLLFFIASYGTVFKRWLKKRFSCVCFNICATFKQLMKTLIKRIQLKWITPTPIWWLLGIIIAYTMEGFNISLSNRFVLFLVKVIK